MADLHTKPRGTAGPTSVLLLLAAASFALAACEGGSGGGGAPALHSGGLFAAAGATPIAGSVTQSSDHTGGVTANPVTVTIEEAGGVLTPNISGQGWGFEDLPVDDDGRSDVTINGESWQEMAVTREYGDDSLRGVVVYTDRAAAEFPTDDYLVMGGWLRIPAKWYDAEGNLVELDAANREEFYSEIEAGVFANGGDPFEQDNIQALTGTATYTGGATAGYADTAKNSDLVASVTLTADFGTDAELGTISGMVNAFRRPGDEAPEAEDLSDADLLAFNTHPLMLGSADIGDSDSGFFTGDATMTVNGDALTGKWGGQFYGNRGTMPPETPAAVAGTFGATAGQKVILGAFGARR